MISARNLTKRFGDLIAVDHLDFRVNKGEFYSLLGPNGAGKSTTINMLSTILPPSEGSITINGLDANRECNAVRRHIGVVPQEIALYDDLSAFDNLRFFGSLYGIPEAALRVRIHRLLDEFGLMERMHEKIKTYSGGMKRRINIASALLHEPLVVIMDEPTVGIDPQSRNNIYEAIERMKKNGTTILYTTHYMEEAERFSDRIGIIDHGKIIAEGSLSELYARTGHLEQMVLDFASLTDEQFAGLKSKINFQLTRTENRIQISSENIRQHIAQIIAVGVESGLEMIHMDIRKPDMETVFLNLTGKTLRDQ
jgi:ABC-2 type transport system ATP-binding protein